jgi:uncharacterized protein (TIGR03066 family)
MGRFRFLAPAIIACFSVGIIQVGAAQEKIDIPKLLVGKWQVTSMNKELPIGSMMQFGNDGKMKITHKADGKEQTLDAVYMVEGNTLRFTLKLGDREEKKGPITIKKVSEQELVLDAEKLVLELKRIK